MDDEPPMISAAVEADAASPTRQKNSCEKAINPSSIYLTSSFSSVSTRETTSFRQFYKNVLLLREPLINYKTVRSERVNIFEPKDMKNIGKPLLSSSLISSSNKLPSAPFSFAPTNQRSVSSLNNRPVKPLVPALVSNAGNTGPTEIKALKLRQKINTLKYTNSVTNIIRRNKVLEGKEIQANFIATPPYLTRSSPDESSIYSNADLIIDSNRDWRGNINKVFNTCELFRSESFR